MQQIINFIIRNKNFLLFLLLFVISFFLTIQTHNYHKSKFISSTNFISGSVYKAKHNVTQYFDLKTQNKILAEENNRLKHLLYSKSQILDTVNLDYTPTSNFKFKTARVIKNSYSSVKNYLTLDKGERDSIHQDQGVISSKGIVGIIDNTSNKYSRVLSVLNSNSRINAQLKKNNHFGTLIWNGDSPNIVQLIDLPKQAPVKKGDTIITGGRSTIFPKGIPIGQIESFKLDDTENYYILQVLLFNDMSNLEYVHVIKNNDANEINSLDLEDE